MVTSETPGDALQRVWICCSERDHERARTLARSLDRAGFAVRGPWSVAAGGVRAEEEARGLSDAHWVVVLACAELTAEERWPAQEALLRAHPQVVVVQLRPSLLRLKGAAVLKVKEADLDARVTLRLQGPTAPAWTSYGAWVRQRHGQVTLWQLREEGAHGAREVELEQLYVAPVLTVVAEASSKDAQAKEPEGKAQPESKDLTPEDLLDRKARCLLIRGEPGLGKSTLLHHLALRALEQPGLLPVWLSAAAAPRSGALVAHLESELAAEDGQYRWLLRDALARGEALLLVDGLDEVEIEARQALVRALQKLRERYPRVRVVLTTRPEATVNVPGAECIDLQRFEPAQSQVLWERLGEVTEQQRPAFREEWQGWSPQIQALAEVPLLLGLLRQVATRGRPLRGRVEVYQAVLRLFLVRWAGLRSEQPQPQRSMEALETALSRVALEMHEAAKESLPEEGFRRRLAEALPRGTDTRRLLADALELGLLKREGGGHLAFQHATFREYLAAQALLADEATWRQHLPALRGDPRWREVLYVAVAQRGILEDNEADAERRLRAVLDGPPTCVGDVLLGPPCLVAELINEGVGAPRAFEAEVLRRLRESLWLEVSAAYDVLDKLSENPELPWDEAWLEVRPSVRLRGDAALWRITAWLAARSKRAREICQKQLPQAENSGWSPELAALGLVRGGERSAPILRALAGWHHLDGQTQRYSVNPNDRLVARRLSAALAEAARWPRTAAAWAIGLLEELRSQLVSSDLQSRLGAAWLLADVGPYEPESESILWDGSWDDALSPVVQDRSRGLLAQLAAESPAWAEALLVRWRGLPAEPDVVMDWLTELLLQQAGKHQVEVIERLLDVVEEEDDERSEWARGLFRPDDADVYGEPLRQALWSRINRPTQRCPAARWRLFDMVVWETQAQTEALRTFLTPDCPLQVRLDAAEQVARQGLSELDELALRALSAGFVSGSQRRVLYCLKDITARAPTLQASFDRLIKDSFAELSAERRFAAARYLYERNLLSKEEWLALGARDLATARGAYRLRLIRDLEGYEDPERLSLALLPELDDDHPNASEVERLLLRLRPQSAEVLSAFLHKLAAGSVSRGTQHVVLSGLVAMLWRRPELVALTLAWLDQEALHALSIELLRQALWSGAECSLNPDAPAGVAQGRETLFALLGEQPPRQAWVIIHLLCSDNIVRTRGTVAVKKEVLLRCLAAEELAAKRLEIAGYLRRLFHDAAPLLAVLRAQCRSADLETRVEAAHRLRDEGQLGPQEHALLAELLRPPAKPELLLVVADLLVDKAVDAQFREQAGLALLRCLDVHREERSSFYHRPIQRMPEEVRASRPATIAEWAGAMLLLLPAYYPRLVDALLSWLRPTSGVKWTPCMGAMLRALSVPTDQIEPLILQRFAAGRDCDGALRLGLVLDVPALRLLPAVLAALLRSTEMDWARYLCSRSWPARLGAQLRFFGGLWSGFPELPSLLGALREHDGAAEECMGALELACEQVGLLDEKTRLRISQARLLLGGATEHDYEFMLALPKDVVALAAVRDGRLRRRLVLAATSPCHDEERFKPLDILRAAENMTTSSARAELDTVYRSWLAENEPAVRLLALEDLHCSGWIEPGHLQPLLELLDGPIGVGWFDSESEFRRLCGELILTHFPEHAAAVHGPLLAVLAGQDSWLPSQRPIPTLLVQAGCPRAPLLASIRSWTLAEKGVTAGWQEAAEAIRCAQTCLNQLTKAQGGPCEGPGRQKKPPSVVVRARGGPSAAECRCRERGARQVRRPQRSGAAHRRAGPAPAPADGGERSGTGCRRAPSPAARRRRR